VLALLACPLVAGAQISGNGLGTAVSQSGGAWTISAGTQVGGNLFHSFSTFGIPTGNSATFTGPGSVQHVIGRVTGPNASSIDGLLRNAIPGADLWLINPHGIAFGPNASLDVQGSVHMATADYLMLGSGGRFDATHPGASTLASAPPSAFGFLGPATPIMVDRSTLATASGKGLFLSGGDMTFNGATLRAPGGTLDLSSQGAITATASTLDVSNGTTPASGTVRIVGGSFMASNTNVLADNGGSAQGGGITMQLAGAMQMTGGGVLSHADGAGRSADIDIQSGSLTLLAGAEVVSGARAGSGPTGDVRVRTAGEVRIEGVDAANFPSGLFAVTDPGSTGSAGSISVQAGSVAITGGGTISASTYGPGSGGGVEVLAAGALSVRGESASGIPSSIYARAEPGSTGAAGSVTVRATCA